METVRRLTAIGTLSPTRALLERLRPARSRAVVSGQAPIWILNALLVCCAAAVFTAGAGQARPLIPSIGIPFWALLLAFAAAERFVVHVHFRRSAHSMSLAEIPLVFGLLFAGGPSVILAGALGRTIVLVVHRRLPAIRIAFNLGQFLLGNCIAVVVFHAVAGSQNGISPQVWAAAALATAAMSLTAVLLISLAVSLSEGPLGPRQIGASLRTDLAVSVANTSIGLCAATLIYHDWKAATLMAIPIGAMFLTFRAYAAERQRHERLEFLYQAARALSRSADTGAALRDLLGQAVEAFRAEVVEIIFFSPDGTDALRTSVRAGGSAEVLAAVDPETAAQFRSLIDGHEAGACATAELGDCALSGYLRGHALSDGMFAVLKGERGWLGAMMVGQPSGVVDHFSAEDLKLFETLANNTSVALENDRLGQAMWRMMELQRELKHQASHDPLTDLANRSLFAERVAQALQSDPDGVSVIFIDVNDFKTVNDSLGHAAGDDLLIAISRRLSDCVRPSDTVGRLGGDEFAIMLERTPSHEEAVEVTERIIRRLTERFSIGGQSISVRASAGIATGRGGELSAHELIRNADVAMYRAKQASKHGYELFESGMEIPVLKRHGIKQRLRDAVNEEALAVHYQPIVELSSGRVAACEALVRWFDGPRGLVTPESFIPIAEEMGVIAPMGRAVLRRACQDAKRWGSAQSPGPAVHVNLSPVELRDRRIVSGVEAMLDRSGLAPDRLVLEITEGVVLRDPEASIARLEELRGLGVQLALDDFGTGYSSLSQLRSLPIDWLKIGKPFVDTIEQGGVDQAFVQMILDLAASLELRVVAEGIETAGQLAALRALGCGFGQGFYLGSPTELEQSWLAPRRRRISEYPAELRAIA